MGECSVRAKRAAMTDDEFWADVFPMDNVEPEPDDDAPGPLAIGVAEPCPLCGAGGACGYDDEGRPMIHSVPVELEQDCG